MAVSIRLGQDGGYILAPNQEDGELQVDPLKGYVFIADPDVGGT